MFNILGYSYQFIVTNSEKNIKNRYLLIMLRIV